MYAAESHRYLLSHLSFFLVSTFVWDKTCPAHDWLKLVITIVYDSDWSSGHMTSFWPMTRKRQYVEDLENFSFYYENGMRRKPFFILVPSFLLGCFHRR